MGKLRIAAVWGLLVLAALALLVVPGCGPKKVAVPSVVSGTTAQAKTTLEAAKLSLGATTGDYSATVASGTVLSQQPTAGAQADEGSSVAIVVSKGLHPIAVPDVQGMKAKEASAALAAAGLSMVSYEQYEATATAGMTFNQVPNPGVEVAPGSEVAVGVSLGVAPGGQTVPAVVGATKSSAVAKLKKAGFEVTVNTANVVGAKANSVVEQVPAKGAKANPGSHVIIMVSTGSPVATVPSVVNMSRSTAIDAMNNVGFTTAVYQMPNPTVPSGKIFTQMAAAGTEQRLDSQSALVVSLGPLIGDTVMTPTVKGQTSAAAQQAIVTAGLVPAMISVHDPSVPAGAVIAQAPDGNSGSAPGGQVLISISLGPIQKAQAKVPSVTGKTSSAAESALKAAGLETHADTLYSPTVAKGKVMGQLPAAGSTLMKGATVHYVISLGKPSALFVTMPNFVGMTEKAATAAISDLGLAQVTVGDPTSDKPVGTVVDQDPTPGAKTGFGANVALLVSR